MADGNLDNLDAFVVSGAAGEIIFNDGDTGTEMFIIQQGQIEIFKEYAGTVRTLASLEVGDFFGETSLLEEVPRDTSARALTDCRLLKIDQATFDEIVREDPEIAIRMLRKMSHRLRERAELDARAAEIAQGPLRVAQAAPAPVAPPAAPAPESRRAILRDPKTGTELALADRTEWIVGRVDHATGSSPNIDLAPFDTDRTLSRRHARIVLRGSTFFLREEMGTRNGTFVNNERLANGAEVALADGNELRFGLVAVVFQLR